MAAELNLESEPGKGTTITILFEKAEKSVQCSRNLLVSVLREQQVKAARRKKSMEYVHQAQYYETDQMGIIHHSNYIR